eukprot:149480_1
MYRDKTICGDKGEFIKCKKGFAIGACGSGKYDDCYQTGSCTEKDQYNALKCQDNGYRNTISDWDWQCGQFGHKLQCVDDKALVGLCGSGEGGDCRFQCGDESKIAAIACVTIPGIKIQKTIEACSWRSPSEWGGFSNCETGELMTGYCGSGMNLDCGSHDQPFQIKCCPYTYK